MPVIIKITEAFVGGHLTLERNGGPAFRVITGPRSIIHWQPKPALNIVIDGISEKTGYPIIFDARHRPARIGTSRNFGSTLIDSGTIFESYYYISWHFEGSTKLETFDPIMSINPRLPPGGKFEGGKFNRYIIAFIAAALSVIVLRRMTNMKAELSEAKGELSKVKGEISEVKNRWK